MIVPIKKIQIIIFNIPHKIYQDINVKHFEVVHSAHTIIISV